MWHLDSSIEIIKVDVKSFMTTFNAIDALLYIDNIGMVTFYGRNDEGH